MTPKRSAPRRASARKAAARRTKVPRKLLVAAVIGSACVDAVFRKKLFAARDPVAWIAARIKARDWVLTELERTVLGALMRPAYKKRLEASCAKAQTVVKAGTEDLMLKHPWCTYPCAL